jgi:hypothetical protein
MAALPDNTITHNKGGATSDKIHGKTDLIKIAMRCFGSGGG